MGWFKQKFRNIKKFPTWIYWFPSVLYRMYFRLCFRSRVVNLNECDIHDYRETIACTWHNRLFFFPLLFPDKTRHNTSAMISASRDGQYLVDFISMLGVKSLRGSSSKKAVDAQLGAVHALQEGRNVVFTPDGPRGPRYQIKRGPIHLASVTGKPLVVLGINYSRSWRLKSWDQFRIPKPFSTVTMTIGKYFRVPPDLSEEELEKYRVAFQNEMLKYTED